MGKACRAGCNRRPFDETRSRVANWGDQGGSMRLVAFAASFWASDF